MGVLLLLAVVVAAVAGAAWFYLRPKQCAAHPPSRRKTNSTRTGPPSTRTAVEPPEPSTRTAVASAVRNRNKPTELDQRDLFAEFMEKEGLNSPSNANTPTKGSSERKAVAPGNQMNNKTASAVTEAPTQLSELSSATPAITPLPTLGNTPTKDVQTAALLPTPAGEQSTKSGSKKKKKKAKKGSRLSMSKPTVTASSKSKKSKKGKKKSAGKY